MVYEICRIGLITENYTNFQAIKMPFLEYGEIRMLLQNVKYKNIF